MAYELHRRAVPPQTSLAGIAFTMRAARAWLMDGAAAHEARISRVQRAAGNLTATGKYADDQLRTVAALRALGPGVWVVVDSGPDSGRRLTLDDFDHYIDHYYAAADACVTNGSADFDAETPDMGDGWRPAQTLSFDDLYDDIAADLDSDD